MDQAKTLVQQGRWIEAVKVYRDILLKDRSNAAAWRALGDVYYHLDKRDYAIQCYGNYLKLRPDDWELAAWLERYKAVVPVPTPSKP
jgi:Flp pilus assembly protein TadD